MNCSLGILPATFSSSPVIWLPVLRKSFLFLATHLLVATWPCGLAAVYSEGHALSLRSASAKGSPSGRLLCPWVPLGFPHPPGFPAWSFWLSFFSSLKPAASPGGLALEQRVVLRAQNWASGVLTAPGLSLSPGVLRRGSSRPVSACTHVCPQTFIFMSVC